VGLKPAGAERGVFRGASVGNEDEYADHAAHIKKLPGIQRLSSDELRLPMLADGSTYPAVVVAIDAVEQLESLRSMEGVDFVEPLYFMDGIGCGIPQYGMNGADEVFTPDPSLPAFDRVSWNFRHMGIQDAWKLYRNQTGDIVAPGDGITIGVIDTGIFDDAPRLDPATFVQPTASRQPPQRLSVLANPTVVCSHGTRISGLATAPAAGIPNSDANYVGVAWGADLLSVQIGNGVVHTDATVLGVVAGLDLAVASGARVLTMAFGMPFVSDFLRDNIVRIFDSNPGVLMIAAAGTNVPFVVFPASMDREVLAVTLIDYKPSATSRYKKYLPPAYLPDIVAYGPSVDFAAVNGQGDMPTQGNQTEPLTTIGGSSAATAIVAGIAALAWAKLPSLTRAELITRLAMSASLAGIEGEEGVIAPSRNVGYGIPDAYVAAGGARKASIDGPFSAIPGSTYALTASNDGYEPNFTYLWDSGETSRSIQAIAGSPGLSRLHSVAMTNSIDGSVVRTSQLVVFAGSHLRRIYSEEMVSEWATFLDGKRVDRLINAGRVLPRGCSMAACYGLEYVRQNGEIVPNGSAVEIKDNGNNGFTISRPGGLGAGSLEVYAHVWHDGLSSIRVRAVYDVWEADGIDCVEPGVTRLAP
jgi:hypothetical protein